MMNMDTNEKLLFINKQSVELQWERERERDADKNEICYLLINNPSNFTGEREREREREREYGNKWKSVIY
jgi:hypothetical protein